MLGQEFETGKVILLDKPLHWTSFQAVNKLKYLLKKQFGFKKIKIGHAGTLDPLATGLLIVCSGKATKQISTFQDLPKEYTGTFVLGATTPSYDLETEINQTFSTNHLTNTDIEAVIPQFLGEIDQKPPLFSAIQKDGKRLYDLARAGKTIDIEARKITVYEFEITRIQLPEVDFRIVCSKGTYIRSIAHDFGLALNNGAHLTALKRTRIGSYSVTEAVTIDDFLKNISENE